MGSKKLLLLFGQVLLIISILLLGSSVASRNVERTAKAYEKTARELMFKPQNEDGPWGHGWPPVTKPDRT